MLTHCDRQFKALGVLQSCTHLPVGFPKEALPINRSVRVLSWALSETVRNSHQTAQALKWLGPRLTKMTQVASKVALGRDKRCFFKARYSQWIYDFYWNVSQIYKSILFLSSYWMFHWYHKKDLWPEARYSILACMHASCVVLHVLWEVNKSFFSPIK